MKTRVRKQKGKKLQNWLRKKLLDKFNNLEKEDIVSTPASVLGEDLLLSPKARKLIPFTFECKSYASFSVYKHLEQAERGKHTPVACLKANHKKPVVVMYAEDFIKLIK